MSHRHGHQHHHDTDIDWAAMAAKLEREAELMLPYVTEAAEAALLTLVASGVAVRHPLGDDAVWQSATAGEAMDFAAGQAVTVG